MQREKIMTFHTINDFQLSLEKGLEDLKKRSEEYSKLIGEKLRDPQTDNSKELAELKEKLEGPTDPKKKKTVKKKDQKANWLNFDAISIYDGIGLKGELELYFKALEDVKQMIEKLQKVKESVDSLVSKGLKMDLGCMIFMENELPFEMTFVKSLVPKAKFSYKAIFSVEKERPIEIKN